MRRDAFLFLLSCVGCLGTAGCQGSSPDAPAPDAGHGGALVDATAAADADEDSATWQTPPGDGAIGPPPCNGTYTCTQPGAVPGPFTVWLSEAGGVCRWATIGGYYDVNPDGTLSFEGSKVATWSGDESAFDVVELNNPPTGPTDPLLIHCDYVSPATVCASDGGDDCPFAALVDGGLASEEEGLEAGVEGNAYPDPPEGSPVTWASWVSGFSSYYCESCHNPNAQQCSGPNCHVPANPGLYSIVFDMSERVSWTTQAATIHCGIVTSQPSDWDCGVPAETFPKMSAGAPLPSDEERGIIASWIEAGCP